MFDRRAVVTWLLAHGKIAAPGVPRAATLGWVVEADAAAPAEMGEGATRRRPNQRQPGRS
ncbi:hypothetical protein [Streptomyces sp. NPDC059874]|uniref:hypothetical protein n=1 Tax=Streptomyces sp. NPDC059874 TaxID=3346983 RepID=UPI00366344D7